jgi:hypothetical protein
LSVLKKAYLISVTFDVKIDSIQKLCENLHKHLLIKGEYPMNFLDELLKQAQQSPDWQNLPGQGKPLNLDQDPHTPDEMRMAYKILKENDLAPAWIMEGKELDTQREKLVTQIHAAGKTGSIKASLQESITAFNRRVLSYNLKIPQGIPHKRTIDPAREMGR